MQQQTLSHPKNLLSSSLNVLDSYEIGQRLRLARIEKGLKQKDLIEDQFSKSYISSIEAGRLLPSPRALDFFALRLGITTSYLQWGIEVLPEEPDKSMEPFSDQPNEVHRSPLNRKRLNADISLDLVQIQLEGGLYPAALEQLATLGLPSPEVGPAFNARYSFLLGQAELGLHNNSLAISHFNQAQNYLQSLPDPALNARLNKALGDCFFSQKSFREALSRHRQTLEAIKRGEIKDPNFEARVLFSLARDFLQLNEQGPALSYLQEVSLKAGHLIDRKQAAAIYQALSLHHQKMGDFPEAKFFSGKSLAILEEFNNLQFVVELENKYGQLLLESGSFKEAELSLKKALNIAVELNDFGKAASAALNLSQVFMKSKEPNREKEFAELGIELAQKSGEALPLARSQARLANIFAGIGDFIEADKTFSRALETLEGLHVPHEIGMLYFEFGRTLMNLGRDREAASLFEKAYTFQSGFSFRKF